MTDPIDIKNPSDAASRLDADEKMTLDLTEGAAVPLRPDQARARFAAEVHAMFSEVETAARMALEDALEKAEASIANRARKLMAEARLIECARCEAEARRNWWRGGRAIAARLWSGE